MVHSTFTEVKGHEEAVDKYVLRRSVWFIFPVNWWEKVSTESIGNDIHITTNREIRAVYLNGKKLVAGDNK